MSVTESFLMTRGFEYSGERSLDTAAATSAGIADTRRDKGYAYRLC
jgi:hypothetical protein